MRPLVIRFSALVLFFVSATVSMCTGILALIISTVANPTCAQYIRDVDCKRACACVWIVGDEISACIVTKSSMSNCPTAQILGFVCAVSMVAMIGSCGVIFWKRRFSYYEDYSRHS